MATTRVATTMMTMVRRKAPPGRVIVVATLVVAISPATRSSFPFVVAISPATRSSFH
ncbi:MAG TPA: hypothetical protein VKR42_11520 [Ktedonobacteraceae bacterium]|nr:hypothetical protein [Ktedonobacteraceae bacterium]